MDNAILADKVKYVEDMLCQAASIEKMLPDKERKKLQAKASWPDYLYDADDRKDQEAEPMGSRPSAKQIDLYERVIGWLKLLGMRRDKRTVVGKRVVWDVAGGVIYDDISKRWGVPPTTAKRWYKQDIIILTKKIISLKKISGL